MTQPERPADARRQLAEANADRDRLAGELARSKQHAGHLTDELGRLAGELASCQAERKDRLAAEARVANLEKDKWSAIQRAEITEVRLAESERLRNAAENMLVVVRSRWGFAEDRAARLALELEAATERVANFLAACKIMREDSDHA